MFCDERTTIIGHLSCALTRGANSGALRARAVAHGKGTGCCARLSRPSGPCPTWRLGSQCADLSACLRRKTMSATSNKERIMFHSVESDELSTSLLSRIAKCTDILQSLHLPHTHISTNAPFPATTVIPTKTSPRRSRRSRCSSAPLISLLLGALKRACDAGYRAVFRDRSGRINHVQPVKGADYGTMSKGRRFLALL